MRTSVIRRSLPAALLVLAACGTSASGSTSQSKSGEATAPTTITIATAQDSNTPAALPLEEFVKQVDERSGGSLKVEVRYNQHDGSDPPLIADLRKGDVDMAVIAARAWSAEGVPEFSALQAPFVIHSEEHLNTVARSTKVADEVLATLAPLGVTGLAIYPDGLRHFFALDGSPILSPRDLQGRKVRGPESADTAALVSALGGTLVSTDTLEGTNNGTITAGETGYFGAATEFPSGIIATGNVVPYAKMVTVVAGTAFLDRLTRDQRDAIALAARDAATWSLTHHASEADQAAQFCANGGKIVEATVDQVEAFRAAVAPVLDALRKNETSKTIIDEIADLAPPTDAAAPKCTTTGTSVVPANDGPTADEIVADGGDLPNGVYRVELTKEVLSKYPDGNPEQNAGVTTWTLRDGHWAVQYPGSNGSTHTEAGIYQVIGHDLYWQYLVSDPPPFGRSAHLTWSLDGKGSILWTQIAPAFKDYVFGVPWVRVSG